MKGIFDQKSEMEPEKKKLEKRLKNISVIKNDVSQTNINPANNNNNNSNKSINMGSRQLIPELPQMSQPYPNTTRFLEELSPDRNVANSNLVARMELENFKSRAYLQQKSLFEELEVLKLNAQKSAFEKNQAISELNDLKNRLRSRAIENSSFMHEFNRDSSKLFPLNSVRYSKLNDTEYPIVKFGADETLVKKLMFPGQIDLNAKLNDLMNDEYLRNGRKGEQGEREFRGDSEFVDLGNEIYKKRKNSFDINPPKSTDEALDKKANSEHYLDETTRFVPLKEAEKSSGFGGSGTGLNEMYQILEKIDDLQSRRSLQI